MRMISREALMSSLAQEESRSISENVTWGQRKRFADGKVTMPFKHFLGYDRGEDGVPVINEKEAEVVRLIYNLFLHGKTAVGICRHLESLNIPTPSGKSKWRQSTVMSILKNEKYKGDALLQKKFTVDFLTKKQKVNEGEVPQYYAADFLVSHSPSAESDGDLTTQEVRSFMRLCFAQQSLWHEAKRPQYLLLENVPGLLNHNGGKTFGTTTTLTVEGTDHYICLVNHIAIACEVTAFAVSRRCNDLKEYYYRIKNLPLFSSNRLTNPIF